jgi:SAM-dependent methyltransferase
MTAAACGIAAAVERCLACPRCRAPVRLRGESLECCNRACTQELLISHDVVVAADAGVGSFFDRTHGAMSATVRQTGTRAMCYTWQARWLEERLDAVASSGAIVVDVGCGPELPYRRCREHLLVGVDASFEAVRRNRQLDVRVFGRASRLPLRDASVDAIVCFYLLHHLVGNSIEGNHANLRAAFREFGRALKPGGHIYAFEVSPLPPFYEVQRAVWPLVRRLYPGLDMFFWSAQVTREVGLAALPPKTTFALHRFSCPFWVAFPFVFARPWLRLPRALFPFRAYGYEWCVRAA